MASFDIMRFRAQSQNTRPSLTSKLLSSIFCFVLGSLNLVQMSSFACMFLCVGLLLVSIVLSTNL